MNEFWRALWQDESGQDLAEYALLIGLIALVAIVGVTLLGEGISDTFDAIATEVLGWGVPAE